MTVSKIGSIENFELIDTSRIVKSVEFKQSNVASSGFTFPVGYSNVGAGYTVLKNEGSRLDSASIIAHVSFTNVDYDLVITLASNAELFTASIVNVIEK